MFMRAILWLSLFAKIIWAVLALCVTAAPGKAEEAESWTRAGGPNGNFILPARPLNWNWPDGRLPIVWQANAGLGTAPPVVENGRVYIYGLFRPGTTRETIGNANSALTARDAFSNPDRLPAAQTDKFPGTPPWELPFVGPRGEEWAQCLDAKTGRLIWATRLTDQSLAYRENNVVADEAAPLLYRGRLYVHPITGHLFCLDARTGSRKWERNLYETQMYVWAEKEGNTAGPIGYRDSVIVTYEGKMDGDYSRFGSTCLMAAAFDARTGKTRWIAKSPVTGFRVMNTRPLLTSINGLPTIVASAGHGTVGFDPGSGKTRWFYNAPGPTGFDWASYSPAVWKNYIVDARDIAHDDAGSGSWCLRIDGSQVTRLWETDQFKPYSFIEKSNYLASEGRLYGIDSRTYGNETGKRQTGLPPGRGMRDPHDKKFQCRDIATGKLLWSEDFGGSEADMQYLLLAGKTLILTDVSGLWTATLTDTGLTDMRHASLGGAESGEPTLTGSRLYLRQQDAARPLAAVSNMRGNLICLDLSR